MMKAQYQMILNARGVLLDYCAQIAPSDFTSENSTFGRGSIRNLLVHNAYTYQWWIGVNALQESFPFVANEAVPSIIEVRALFSEVDGMMDRFFLRFESDPQQAISAKMGQKSFTSHPLELFSHAITHEFHHKGQILSLSRHLGYEPIDTDIIR